MADFWRPQLHIMPPRGWVNDPNGLCWFRGRYHAYYQYAPNWPQSDLKSWGHCVSDDLLTWQDKGIVLAPNSPADASGVWSGSAWVEKGGASDGGDLMRVFYTGNVIDPSVAERVDEGREANQMLVTSEDGQHFSPKRVLLRNEDMPSRCTLHVRDPKVWEQDGALHMLLGARERPEGVSAGEGRPSERGDRGCVLVLDSANQGESWTLRQVIRPVDAFGRTGSLGHMWECPNLCRMDGHEFLAFCPQGLPSQSFRWQNLWQAGYVPLPQGKRVLDVQEVQAGRFAEWDHGFDFYAPQIFEDGKGRQILIGWMGGFDRSYSSSPDGMGVCHALTLPRELAMGPSGFLRQKPVRELLDYRQKGIGLPRSKTVTLEGLAADIELTDIDELDSTLWLNDVLSIFVDHGTMGMRFAQTNAGKAASAGRTCRRIKLANLRALRVVVDGSTVEVYVNGGAQVFSTRWFPAEPCLRLRREMRARSATAFPLRTTGLSIAG